jgi:hypothetical protein
MTDGRVDQAFFGWSPDAQRLTILASSFESSEAERYWLHRLQAHVRLQPVPGTALPASAFSYFRFDDHAAVLRRVGSGASAGRNNSHALIAPANRLTPEVAVSLASWPQWQRQPPASSFMSPLPMEPFEADTTRAGRRLREQVPACEDEIAVVLTRFLENPSRPLSIVNCPDGHRLTVVWALRQLAERLIHPTPRTLPDWTFSTYEDRHDITVEGLPAIVFLPAKPQAGTVDRAVIDVERPEVNGGDLARSRSLVRVLATGANPDPPPRVDDAEPVRPQPLPQQPGPVVPASRKPARSLADEAVAVLRDARDLGEFLHRLRVLEHNATPAHRPAIRAALDVAAMDVAARFVEIDSRGELFRRLLAVVYGPGFEDLADPRAERHAARLLQRTRSDQLAQMLGTGDNLRREAIREAVVRRWATDGSHPSERSGRMLRRMRATRVSRLLPWLAVAAVLAALGMVFLAGYLAGRPGRAATAYPGPETSAPVESLTPGTANLVAGPDQQVFAFGQAGEDLYPVGPCTAVGNALWHCPTAGQRDVVAIVVPRQQVGDLAARAQTGEKVRRGEGWGEESAVG